MPLSTHQPKVTKSAAKAKAQPRNEPTLMPEVLGSPQLNTLQHLKTKADASPTVRSLAMLQRAASTGRPIQRVVTIGGRKLSFTDILGKMKPAQKKALGRTSKILLKWADERSGEDHNFDSVQELYDALMRLRLAGKRAQQVGLEREKRAGGSSGVTYSETGRGKVIGGKNGVQLVGGYKSQDPFLRHPNGGTLPLDTISDDTWGLVGGPAKAKNEAAVRNELGRLTVLSQCCKIDGEHGAEVRYHDISRDIFEFNQLFDQLIFGALSRSVKVFINRKHVTAVPPDTFYGVVLASPMGVSGTDRSEISDGYPDADLSF